MQRLWARLPLPFQQATLTGLGWAMGICSSLSLAPRRFASCMHNESQSFHRLYGIRAACATGICSSLSLPPRRFASCIDME